MGAIDGEGRGKPGKRRLRYKRGQPHLEEDAGGRAGASILQMDTVQSQRGAKRHHTPSDALCPVVSAETSALDILWRPTDASGGRLFCREPPQGRGIKCSGPPATRLGAGAPEAGPRCEPEGGRQFDGIMRFLSVNPLYNLHGDADVDLRLLKSSELSTLTAADNGVSLLVRGKPCSGLKTFFSQFARRGGPVCYKIRLHCGASERTTVELVPARPNEKRGKAAEVSPPRPARLSSAT